MLQLLACIIIYAEIEAALLCYAEKCLLDKVCLYTYLQYPSDARYKVNANAFDETCVVQALNACTCERVCVRVQTRTYRDNSYYCFCLGVIICKQ